MPAERNHRRIPGKSMTVRELLDRLQQMDPEATVVVDPVAGGLLVLGPRPRVSAPLAEPAEPDFTEDDRAFLRRLRIR